MSCQPHFSSELSDSQIAAWREEASRYLNKISADNNSDNIDRLAAILSASSHLQRLISRFHDDLPALISGGWQNIISQAENNWQQNYQNATNDKSFMEAARLFRNRCHLAIACAELWEHISTETACIYLSDCAQNGVRGAVSYLLNGVPEADCGWTILALGKLGARELNYSSDIDLIALNQTGDDFTPQTKRLCHLLSCNDKNGFAWRVDFRLRPDPSATPLSLPISAATSYYESAARAWERAAFIRARPIAGNLKLGSNFLKSISSFVWRRSFDYTVIDDLQIWLRHLPARDDFLGFDVKLGAFGIRHIELLVHILQLVGGGRHRTLRQTGTAAALKALSVLGWLPEKQAKSLKTAYYKWRYFEHMVVSQDGLISKGFKRPEAVLNIIESWKNGHIAATKSERARLYLNRFLPTMIDNLSEADDPDIAFARFADFVAGLSFGAQPFALFLENPHLATLISDIILKAPILTEQLCQQSALFDNLLEPQFFAPLDTKNELAANCPSAGNAKTAETLIDKIKL